MEAKTLTLALVGSNVFKIGAALSGCINDLTTIYNLAKVDAWFPAFNFRTLQNNRFTKEAFIKTMFSIMDAAPAGGKVWLHLSGHCCVVPLNGVNHTAFVCSNSDWSDLYSFVLDDDIKQIANRRPDVHLYITGDGCESSGFAFRLADADLSGVPIEESRNRFVYGPDDIQMEIDHNGPILRSLMPTLSNVSYISGTGGKGYYSADVGTGKDAYGLFTRTFKQVFKGGMTAEQIAAACRAKMPKDQQPEAHGGLKDTPWVSKG